MADAGSRRGQNARMPVIRRVSVILPIDRWCTPEQNEFKWAIVDRIEALGLATEIFHDQRGKPSLCGPLAWTAANAEFVTRRCVGVAIIGLPRWSFDAPHGAVRLPTEFSHIEAMLAVQLRLPLLALAQEDVERRGAFDNGFCGRIGTFPANASRAWLDTRDFTTPFDIWRRKLEERRDVFLAYCSKSTGTAQAIKAHLEALGATVLDWQTDLGFGNILEQIGRASDRCGAGIFLFTTDDELVQATPGQGAVPRDNVVFEAGYFIAAKGKDRVLIVREQGAKMPADLGGDIYADLPQGGDISSIRDDLERFVAAL